MPQQFDLGNFADNCTIAGATGSSTADGHPIIAGNSDDPFTTRTRLVVVHPDDGYRFVATQIVSPDDGDPVSFDRMHTRGLNSEGFAYTWSAVRPDPSKEPDSESAYGIPFYQFGRLALSQARSVEDAIGLLESYPRAIHGNYLFTDALGELALVEVSTQSMNVETRTGCGWVGRSNHWISDVMARIGFTPDDSDSTAVRYRRITDLMAEGEGRIAPAYIAGCLSDHATLEETGWSICAHGHGELNNGAERGGSVSSEIMQPSLGTMHYAYGWPCGGAVDYPGQQPYQDRSWGRYISFCLEDMEPGEYVSVDGVLTPLAVRYLSDAGGTSSVTPDRIWSRA
ncbi:MAG: hypothetical protein F4Y49_06795 [Dehalococcoidia bacterium]|nr:hypothetical protein [Dehalococcoidia bacterium]MYG82008.1 hypothetical protein [Gemmatimonadota bacterium]